MENPPEDILHPQPFTGADLLDEKRRLSEEMLILVCSTGDALEQYATQINDPEKTTPLLEAMAVVRREAAKLIEMKPMPALEPHKSVTLNP